MLKGQVALVTGASRGIGRGIALQLGEAGATVYVTGREPAQSHNNNLKSDSSLLKTAEEITQRGGKGIAAYCDHSCEIQIEALFKRVCDEQNGQLDILVNNAYSGIQAIFDNIGKKFHECDPKLWDVINNVGLRNHYFCSVYAARMMVKRKSGLIVNISSVGGLTYLFNVPYGIGKAACDRMAADCAEDLREANVTYVSMWPGFVTTEIFQENVVSKESGASNPLKESYLAGESQEYPGKAVAYLAADPNKISKTGRVLITTDLGCEYGFLDKGDRRPSNMRSVRDILVSSNWNKTAKIIPPFIKVPCWYMTLKGSKF